MCTLMSKSYHDFIPVEVLEFLGLIPSLDPMTVICTLSMHQNMNQSLLYHISFCKTNKCTHIYGGK